jgi:hypothetical protein
MVERNLNDKLTFRNHKGEEKTVTREEFRNAARGQQHIDHRPTMVDTPVPNLTTGLDYVERATPKDRMFQLTHINGREV